MSAVRWKGGSNQNTCTRWAISDTFFSLSTCEKHWLTAGTLFVMKLNPQSMVGQFVSAHRQKERGKSIVFRVFGNWRDSALTRPRGAGWKPHFSTYSHHKQRLIQTPQAYQSFLCHSEIKGDREQMEDLEAAATAEHDSVSHCVSGWEAKTCTKP